LPDVASPVATDSYVLLASSGGTVSCLDAETGAVAWEHDFDDGFYASPLLVGETFFLLDRAGTAYTVPAESDFRIAARAELDEACVCTPAVLPGRLYIRGYGNLYCIGNGGR
jgi:outer membrane protein assembly factor BamB